MLRLGSLTASLFFAAALSLTACDNGDDDGGTDEAADGSDGAEEGGVCGEEWAEKDGTTPSIMDIWGAPCTTDEDCAAIPGGDGVCVDNIVGVYDLPGGYCAKLGCELPDTSTSFVPNAMDCDPNGGVSCAGIQGVYTICGLPCTSDSQCGREGYGCRIMPNIGKEGDEAYCLMNPDDCCTSASNECA